MNGPITEFATEDCPHITRMMAEVRAPLIAEIIKCKRELEEARRDRDSLVSSLALADEVLGFAVTRLAKAQEEFLSVL